jgi:hypothetical protein
MLPEIGIIDLIVPGIGQDRRDKSSPKDQILNQ